MKLIFLRKYTLMLVLVLATALGAAKVAGAFPVAEEKLPTQDQVPPPNGAEFGRSVAIDGDLVAVGASGVDAVYVYKWDGDSYSLQQELTFASTGEPGSGAEFGRAVALNGNLLVVGARFAPATQEVNDEKVTVANAGAVYVFLRKAGSWEFEAKLTAGNSAQEDGNFGRALALSGNLLVVTARKELANAPEDGAAYVFERVGQSWTGPVRVTPIGLAAGGYFGQSVALRGNLMVVGARNDNITVGDNPPVTVLRAGAAYVFNRIGNEWRPTAKLTTSDGKRDDQFGFNLAIEGDQVVVGARRADDIGGDTADVGAAYIFKFTGSGWDEIQKLTANDCHQVEEGEFGQGEFGQGVAMTGGFLVVSAWRAKIGDNLGQGAVCLFRRAGQQWVGVDTFTAPDGEAGDQLGHSLSAHGDTIIAGANQVGEPRIPETFGPGYAYIFSK